jgi:hypothetical protein
MAHYQQKNGYPTQILTQWAIRQELDQMNDSRRYDCNGDTTR